MSAPTSLSMHEQLARKCIHFNGIMEKTCKAGISYADVRVGKPYKFPCLKQGGQCLHAQFLTEEEVQEQVKVIEEDGIKVLAAVIMVKAHYKKTKEESGKTACACGGELHYVRAAINGHFWAKCKTCGISFNE